MRRFFIVLTAIFVVLPTMSLLLPTMPRAEAATAGPDLVATVIPETAARAGGSAAFRVLVRNVGGADASGPVEVQLSPSGPLSSFRVSGSGTGWSCPADANRCAYSGGAQAGATLPALTVEAPLADTYPAGDVGLSVQVHNDSDAVGQNNSASAYIPVVPSSGVDLVAAVSGAKAAPAGGSAAFRVLVRNVGGADASGPVEVQLSPSGPLSSFRVSGSGTGWSCPADANRCAYSGGAQAGATLPALTVEAPLADTYPAGDVGLSVQVHNDSDAVGQNNSASAYIPVVPSSGVDLVAAVSGAKAAPAGGSAAFRVLVRNVGGADASGPVEVQLSPSGPLSSFRVSGSGTGWSCPADANRCAYSGGAQAGATLPALTVEAPLADTYPAGDVGLSVQVHNDSDAVGQNNSASAYIPVVGNGLPVDLAVTVDGPGPLTGGQEGTATATVVNVGTQASSGPVTVQLSAPFPQAAAAGSGWSCTSSLACSHPGPVGPGGELPELTLTSTAPAANSTYSIGVGAEVKNGSDANNSNNQTGSGSAVGGVPVDLVVTLAGPGPLVAGQEGTATATVVNVGTQASSGPVTVQLSAPFPQAAAAGSGWSCTSSLACSHPGPVGPGGELPELTLTSTAPAANSTYSIGVGAEVKNGSDANNSNNQTGSGSAVGGVPVDLVVTLAGPGPLVAGQEGTATATVVNVGTQASSGPVTVQLSAPFPQAAAAGSGWSCTSSLACSHPGPVGPGGELPELTLTTAVPAGTQPTTAGISASLTSTSDTNTTNNTASTTVPTTNRSGPGRLVVDVSANTANGNITDGVNPSDQVAYQVTITNPGAHDVPGPVAVSLTTSIGLVAETVGGTGWTCPSLDSCSWPVGVDSGSSISLSVQARISDSPPSRVYLLAAARYGSPPSAPIARTLPLNVRASGVDLMPSVRGIAAARAGGSAAFRVLVRNVGGADASGPVEVQLSPSGPLSSFRVSGSGTGWSCPADANRCAYSGGAQAGATLPALTVEAPLADTYPAGDVGLSVQVHNDSDAVGQNNSASAYIPVVPSSGVDLVAAVSGAKAAPAGGSAAFRVLVRNVGGADASGPVEVQLSPSGPLSSFRVSGSGTGWSCPADANRCAYSGGAQAGATLPALTVEAPLADTYPAGDVGLSVQVHNDSDAVGQNNSASAYIPVVPSSGVDLVAAVSGAKAAPAGGSAAFRVLVRNVGGADASGPVEVQLSPSGPLSSFRVSGSGTGWSCPADANRCAYSGGAQAGATLPALTVEAPLADTYPAGDVGLSVQVHNDSDAVGQNNSASAYIPVVGNGLPVDLAVTVDGPGPLTGGQEGTATATVVNVGTQASSGPVTVQLSAPFPQAAAAGSGWSCTSSLACSHPGPVGPGGELPELTLTSTAPAANSTYSIGVGAEVKNGSDANNSNNQTGSGSAVGGVPVDLVVTLAGPGPLVAGQEGTATATVVNVGTQASSGPVTVQLSAPFPQAAAAGSGWSCTSSLACSHPGPVGPGGELPELTLTSTAPAANSTYSIGVGAEVKNGSDANNSNNQTGSGSAVGGVPVDLVVTLAGPGPLVAGQEGTATATVVNVGTQASSGPVTVQLSAPFPQAAAAGSGWSCTSSLACSHPGPVGPGGELPELTLTTAVPAGTQPTTAGISASLTSTSDTNTTNNTASSGYGVGIDLANGHAASAYFDVEALSVKTWPGGTLDFQVQLAGAAPLAGRLAQLQVQLPNGVSYRPNTTMGGPAEPSGSATHPVWQFQMPAEGVEAAFRFSTQVEAAADEGAVSAQGILTDADGAERQTDSAEFSIVHPTLTGVTPTVIGRSHQVTVSFTGGLLQPSFRYELVRDGTTLTGTVVAGRDRRVDVVFDTTEASAGDYDARVETRPGAQLTRPGAVTIDPSTKIDVYVDMNGPDRIRLNAPGRYLATVTNKGNVDLFDIPVVFTAPIGVDVTTVAPEAKALMANAVDAMTSATPGPGQLSPEQSTAVKDFIQSYEPAPVPDPTQPRQYMMTLVPRLAPGESATSVFQVTPRSRLDGDVRASVPVDSGFAARTGRVADIQRRAALPNVGRIETVQDGVSEVCNDPTLVEAGACAYATELTTRLDQAGDAAKTFGCVSFVIPSGGFVNYDCSFNNPFDPMALLKRILLVRFPALKPVDTALGRFQTAFSFITDFYDAFFGPFEEKESRRSGVQFGAAAVDPNEKIGPGGSGDQRYVAAGSEVGYTVRFENVPSAEAAAQRVTITDQLPSQIDWASAHVVGAEVAGTEIGLTATATEDDIVETTGSATLDLSGRSVLFDAGIDASTGRLVAHLQGPSDLDDPFSPTPYSDFLPPNATAPEGEGSIRIRAQLKPGLATGTQVRNQATIRFDDHLDGPAIDTNTTVNAVDADPPTVTLDTLPATVDKEVKLDWTTRDNGSGVDVVQVYQSVDGGPMLLVRAAEDGTQTSIPVEHGHRYAFAARAVDKTGLIGPISAAMETTSTASDTTPPTASMTQPSSPATVSTSVAIVWTGTDDGAGIANFDVRYRRAPYNGPFGVFTYPSAWQQTTNRTATLMGALSGYTYCFSVRSRDQAGNISPWSNPRCTAIPLDDRALTASSGWRRATGPEYWLKTYTTTTKRGATLTRTGAQLDRLGIVATKCPTCGSVALYVNNQLIGNANLAATTTQRKAVVMLPPFSYRTGTIVIKVLSAGKTVTIDGVVVSRSQ